MKKTGRAFVSYLVAFCMIASLFMYSGPIEAEANDTVYDSEVESNDVSTQKYTITRRDSETVKISNSDKTYLFHADESKVFYSLMDTRSFNLVYDNTGKIYVNEHNGSFVVKRVTCEITDTAYYFRYYNSNGNQIQEEHSNGCGGTTPYGAYLYNLTTDTLMASCYHGGGSSSGGSGGSSSSGGSNTREDTVDYYYIYDGNVIEFDTSCGPLYSIDYIKKKILGCTSSNPQLLDCYTRQYESGNALTLTVKSDERNVASTYEFDLSKNHVSGSGYYKDNNASEDVSVPKTNSLLVSRVRYNVERIDDSKVKISNADKSYEFEAGADKTFYSLMDGRSFNLVFDNDGVIYINEYNESFKPGKVSCYVNGDDYQFTFYDRNGNWIQEEHKGGSSGTTPYGCYLYDLSAGKLITECYHGNDNVEVLTTAKESQIVSAEPYAANMWDAGIVKISNSNNVYYFAVDGERQFYSLMDTRSFNLVYDNTGKIYVNEHCENFVIDKVTCELTESSYYFRYYDKNNNQIQEEHSNGCGGSSPYGCYLYDLTNDSLLASCYHGGEAWNGLFDTIDYYNVYDGGIVEFDTSCGPLYSIDYVNKKIVGCTSSNPRLISLELNDNTLRITVRSDERNQNSTYEFDLTKNHVAGDGYYDSVVTGLDFGYEDTLDYYNIQSGSILQFDTSAGPYYSINFSDKRILSCTSTGAVLKSCDLTDNILTICVYSDEAQVDRTYTFDISEDYYVKKAENYSDDQIDYCRAYLDGTVEFDSTRGPLYHIDYINGKILSCTSSGAEIVSCVYNETVQTVTLVVFSDELPMNKEYVIGLDRYMQSEEDVLDYYSVYDDGTIKFDSSRGPQYVIDYVNKKILGCTSTQAVLKNCVVDGSTLSVTVNSLEYPVDSTYVFDLSSNKVTECDYGEGTGDYFGKDVIQYYNILPFDNTLEFDSEYGPYYKISLKDGSIVSCTSDAIYPDQQPARVLYFNKIDERITITVYSAELPYKMTYVFDTESNQQVCGVGNYSASDFEEKAGEIIDSIISGDYEGSGIDEDTQKKIVKASKEGKAIRTNIECRDIPDKGVDDEDRQKVEEYLEDTTSEAVQYMDISISVTADGKKLGNISELDGEIGFDLDFGEEIEGDDHSLLRIHKGKVDNLDLSKNENGTGYSFKSGNFSTYVVTGKKNKPADNGTTDDNNNNGNDSQNSENTGTDDQTDDTGSQTDGNTDTQTDNSSESNGNSNTSNGSSGGTSTGSSTGGSTGGGSNGGGSSSAGEKNNLQALDKVSGITWTGNLLSWNAVKNAGKYSCMIEVNDGKETTRFSVVVTGNSIDVEAVLKEKKCVGKLTVSVTVTANPEDSKTFKSGEGVQSSNIEIELESSDSDQNVAGGGSDAKNSEKERKAILKTLKLRKKSKTLSVGKTFKIKLGKKFDTTLLKKIKYKSDNKAVATVTKDGKVKAVSKGKATVKVTVVLKDGTKKALKCKVKVKN